MTGSTVSCTDNSDGSGNPNRFYRLTSGGTKLRHYPHPDVAFSWNDEWYHRVVDLDCTNLEFGEPLTTKPGNLFELDTVYCDGDGPIPGEVGDFYRFENDELRLFPTYAIATTWSSDWYANAKGIDCTGLDLGDEMPSHPPIAEGAPTRCVWETEVTGSYKWITVFRFTKGKLRKYIDADTAWSWDLDWDTTFTTIDCTGLKIGPEMEMKPADLEEGNAVRCINNSDSANNPNKVYRFTEGMIRWYKTPAVATSWDSHWSHNMQFVNCGSITIGPNMPLKIKV